MSEVCRRYGVSPSPPSLEMKLGISRSALEGGIPLHGLRHPPEAGTCGWYIWAGEFSDAADFFLPLHVAHLAERCPRVLPYLDLPPGWRFLIDGQGYEDVWRDDSLLNSRVR